MRKLGWGEGAIFSNWDLGFLVLQPLRQAAADQFRSFNHPGGAPVAATRRTTITEGKAQFIPAWFGGGALKVSLTSVREALKPALQARTPTGREGHTPRP